MARLYGAQRLVLQAIQDAQGETSAFIEDTKIAQDTRIALRNMRDWVETLEGEGYVEIARTQMGLSASITARGRLALGQFRASPNRLDSPGQGLGDARPYNTKAEAVGPLVITLDGEDRPTIRLPILSIEVEERISEGTRSGIWPGTRIEMTRKYPLQEELDQILAGEVFPPHLRRRSSEIRKQLEKIAVREARMGRGVDILLQHGRPGDLVRPDEEYLSILALIGLFKHRIEINEADTKIEIWKESQRLVTSVELVDSEVLHLLSGRSFDFLRVPWTCGDVPMDLLRDKFLPAMVHAIVRTDADLKPSADRGAMLDFFSWNYGLA